MLPAVSFLSIIGVLRVLGVLGFLRPFPIARFYIACQP